MAGQVYKANSCFQKRFAKDCLIDCLGVVVYQIAKKRSKDGTEYDKFTYLCKTLNLVLDVSSFSSFSAHGECEFYDECTSLKDIHGDDMETVKINDMVSNLKVYRDHSNIRKSKGAIKFMRFPSTENSVLSGTALSAIYPFNLAAM